MDPMTTQRVVFKAPVGNQWIKECRGVLVLTRRVGESVMIGDDVSVKVLGVKGNQVRVGIDAPKHVAVHREEIYERIKAAKCADIAEAINGSFSSVAVHR